MWTPIRKEKELHLAACGDGEREMSSTTHWFLFGRLRVCGATVRDGRQEGQAGGAATVAMPIE